MNLDTTYRSAMYIKGRKYGISFRNTCIYALTAFTLIFYGCDKPDNGAEKELKITGVSIPASINISPGGEIVLTGKGFAANDEIHLTLVSDPTKEFVSVVTSVTEQSVTFTIPDGVTSGTYTLSVRRGDESLALGNLVINIVADTDIPDQPGMTIKGVVYCNGQGIPGVVVSDGVEVTVTDANGVYYLPSQKQNGYVFISLPGNYEIAKTGNLPQFYKILAG